MDSITPTDKRIGCGGWGTRGKRNKQSDSEGGDRQNFVCGFGHKGDKEALHENLLLFPGLEVTSRSPSPVHYGVPWNLSSAISPALEHLLAPAPIANLTVGSQGMTVSGP